MGDMEIIDQFGVRATFTDDGVKVDLVPEEQCCEICNDARFMTHEGFKKCVNCGFEDYLKNDRNDYRPN
jgi:hypothetical protein